MTVAWGPILLGQIVNINLSMQQYKGGSRGLWRGHPHAMCVLLFQHTIDTVKVEPSSNRTMKIILMQHTYQKSTKQIECYIRASYRT